MASLKLTTTQTVTIADLGARTFTHPLTDYELIGEYKPEEIRDSPGIQAALTAGYITIKDSNGISITNVSNQTTPIPLVIDATLSASSDILIPSQKAVKTYSDVISGSNYIVSGSGYIVSASLFIVSGSGYTVSASIPTLSSSISTSLALKVPSAYGHMYEDNAAGTTIAVSNAGYVGWATATGGEVNLMSFNNTTPADNLTILAGGEGTYLLNLNASCAISNTTPLYRIGIFKDLVLINTVTVPFRPSTTTSEVANVSLHAIIPNLVAGNAIAVGLSSNNATSRNIIVYRMDVVLTRIK